MAIASPKALVLHAFQVQDSSRSKKQVLKSPQVLIDEAFDFQAVDVE